MFIMCHVFLSCLGSVPRFSVSCFGDVSVTFLCVMFLGCLCHVVCHVFRMSLSRFSVSCLGYLCHVFPCRICHLFLCLSRGVTGLSGVTADSAGPRGA